LNDRLQESGKVAPHGYKGKVAISVSLSASDRVGKAALEQIETKKYGIDMTEDGAEEELEVEETVRDMHLPSTKTIGGLKETIERSLPCLLALTCLNARKDLREMAS
jgi:hypothetical protein